MFSHNRRNRKIVSTARTHQHKKQGPALRSEDQTPSSVFYYYIAFVQKSKCIFDRLKVFQLSFPLLQTNRILRADSKKRKSGKMQRPARNHGIYAKIRAYLFIFPPGRYALRAPLQTSSPIRCGSAPSGRSGQCCPPGDTKCWPCGPRPRTGTLPGSGIQSR